MVQALGLVLNIIEMFMFDITRKSFLYLFQGKTEISDDKIHTKHLLKLSDNDDDEEEVI